MGSRRPLHQGPHALWSAPTAHLGSAHNGSRQSTPPGSARAQLECNEPLASLGPLPRHPAPRALDGSNSDPSSLAVHHDSGTGMAMPPPYPQQRAPAWGGSPGQLPAPHLQCMHSPPRPKEKMGSDFGSLCPVHAESYEVIAGAAQGPCVILAPPSASRQREV